MRNSFRSVRFFNEDTNYVLRKKMTVRKWLAIASENENVFPGHVNIIFCSDDFLYALNKKYLSRDTLTDIIAFDFSTEKNELSGDIYISPESAKENAIHYGVPTENEIHRLIIHGFLHLSGYRDNTPASKKAIRDKEDYYLSLLANLLE